MLTWGPTLGSTPCYYRDSQISLKLLICIGECLFLKSFFSNCLLLELNFLFEIKNGSNFLFNYSLFIECLNLVSRRLLFLLNDRIRLEVRLLPVDLLLDGVLHLRSPDIVFKHG